MVFQKPNPFPKSIYENVAFGPRIARHEGATSTSASSSALRQAALWDEVKDRLKRSALGALGRAAAAPLHRPRARRRARGAPDGRARSALDPIATRDDRGSDPRAEARLHDRDRDAQHAAGRARRRPHRVLQLDVATTATRRRAGRVRRDARRSSRTRATSAPRTTSPAASAEQRLFFLALSFTEELAQLEASLQEEGDLVLRALPRSSLNALARQGDEELARRGGSAFDDQVGRALHCRSKRVDPVAPGAADTRCGRPAARPSRCSDVNLHLERMADYCGHRRQAHQVCGKPQHKTDEAISRYTIEDMGQE